MNAKSVPDSFLIVSEHILDGKVVIETPCHDFDHYRRLPQVLSYKGVLCGKTGWSSDTDRACYKQTNYIAHKVAESPRTK